MSNRELSVHQEHEFLGRLEEAGLDKASAQSVIDNKELARQVVGLIKSGGQASGTAGVPVCAFPTWKTIELGTHKDVKALRKAMENAGIRVGDYASSMLKHSMFTLASALELVRVSVADLGFPSGATRAQIYEAALCNGLSLCPAEVGPQVRLQYMDQPKGERFFIAMEPIPDSVGNPLVFYVERADVARWLIGRWSKPDYVWYGDDQWVFCRSKKSA
ncbi:hypothetical protein C4546_04755 [Candidatus Parcubacteria bacterium]|jgi:hypothetical protein|nr:MAG: hypothetical protein C4546_04755 [Candidatus Parcubacteria bacterium]